MWFSEGPSGGCLPGRAGCAGSSNVVSLSVAHSPQQAFKASWRTASTSLPALFLTTLLSCSCTPWVSYCPLNEPHAFLPLSLLYMLLSEAPASFLLCSQALPRPYTSTQRLTSSLFPKKPLLATCKHSLFFPTQAPSLSLGTFHKLPCPGHYPDVQDLAVVLPRL